MPEETPSSLNLIEILRYAGLLEQVIATAKSLKGSAVGTVHEMPTVKTWIGDAEWQIDLGKWRRLK